MLRSLSRAFVSALLAVFTITASGQTGAPPKEPSQTQATAPPTPTAGPSNDLPLTTQLKETIVYLRSDCLHDYTADDLSPLSKERLATLPVAQEYSLVEHLVDITSKMLVVKASMSKLGTEESAYLKNPNPLTTDPAQLAKEGEWRTSVLLKMTALSSSEIRDMTPAEVDALPTDQTLGTGFLVSLPDIRIKIAAGTDPATVGFTYLVTNRHVVEPGIDTGKLCKIPTASFVILNHKPDATHSSDYAQTIRFNGNSHWHFSSDDSVDLAVAMANIPIDQYDFIRIPTTDLLTVSDLRNRKAVEGESLEPIVRSGTLAMVPEGLLPTTIQRKPGHVLLADAHVFHGNSGSPVFVDTARFAGGFGFAYKFLGVISGEIYENADLSFTVTSSISATVGANSDVSIIVPGWQVLEILDLPEARRERDDFFAAHPDLMSTNSSGSKP